MNQVSLSSKNSCDVDRTCKSLIKVSKFHDKDVQFWSIGAFHGNWKMIVEVVSFKGTNHRMNLDFILKRKGTIFCFSFSCERKLWTLREELLNKLLRFWNEKKIEMHPKIQDKTG